MSKSLLDLDLAGAIRQIAERYINHREGTPAHVAKTKLGKKWRLLERADHDGYIRWTGPQYFPRFLALNLVDEDARTSVEQYTTVVLKSLKVIYERDGDRMCAEDSILEAAKSIDPAASSETVKVGMLFATDFQRFVHLWNVSRENESLNLATSDRFIDFDDLRSAWRQEIKDRARVARSVNTSGNISTSQPSSAIFETISETYSSQGVEGEGGTATVYRVVDSAKKPWALKRLNPEHVSTIRTRRFLNELNFCRDCPHPNVVQVSDSGYVIQGKTKCPFYVMPLYSSTLRKILQVGVPTEKALRYFADILNGVETAHLRGVWHRDLKPENILHDPEADRLLVADFGIAHFTSEEMHTTVLTKPDERLANFRYAAPEQRIPDHTVDQRADIYALGLILNEIFTGHIPQGTRYRQISDVAPAFAYLDELVEQMVRQRPEERPQYLSRIKEELIARGHEFIQLQRLEALKKRVVPESELTDSLISDPIRAVEKEDYRGGMLTMRLNRAVNQKWENCFRLRATAFTVNVSSAMMSFRGDRVFIRVTDHFVPQGVELFKQYCAAANEEYAAQIKREHHLEIERRRAELRRQVAEDEARRKVLEKIRL